MNKVIGIVAIGIFSLMIGQEAELPHKIKVKGKIKSLCFMIYSFSKVRLYGQS